MELKELREMRNVIIDQFINAKIINNSHAA